MNIDIIAVGKLTEKFFKEGVDEYLKRISRFAAISLIELKDEKNPKNDQDIEKIKNIEGERIISKISKGSYVIALCIEGRSFDSVEFSKRLEDLKLGGISHVTFIIGGSMGLSEDLIKLANLKLSFSKFTFPHQLMRLILVEQIYRALTIENGLPYHK